MSHVTINGIRIWYEKFGAGPNPVLMIPGAIGQAKSDFYIQFDPAHPDHLDQERFTWICVELPGWGRSVPPERQYTTKTWHTDAEYCNELMQKLGYEKYSVYGWSGGSKVALIMAHKYGHKLYAVVVQGCASYASDRSCKQLLYSRDLQNWDYQMLLKYQQAYGDDMDRVEDLWHRYFDLDIANYGKHYPQGLLGPVQEGLRKIRCPVLVMHGDRDFFVELAQTEKLHQNIPNCELVRFPNGCHNLHQKLTAKFKEELEQFLLKHVTK